MDTNQEPHGQLFKPDRQSVGRAERLEGARAILKQRLYATLLDQVLCDFEEEEALDALLSEGPLFQLAEEARTSLRMRVVDEVVQSLTAALKEEAEQVPEHLLTLAVEKVTRQQVNHTTPSSTSEPASGGLVVEDPAVVPETLADLSLLDLEVDAWDLPAPSLDGVDDSAARERGSFLASVDLEDIWYGEEDPGRLQDGQPPALPDFLRDYDVPSVEVSTPEEVQADTQPSDVAAPKARSAETVKKRWGSLFSWRRSRVNLSEEPGAQPSDADEYDATDLILYGLFSAATEVSTSVYQHIDALSMRALPVGDLLAIVSRQVQEEEAYHEPGDLERDYLALTKALQETGLFLPFPYGTIFPDETDLHEALADGHEGYLKQLQELTEHEEWWVTVTRDPDRLRSRVVETSMKVKDLLDSIKNDPGAAQHKKEMISVIRAEVDRFSDECATDVHDALMAIALEGRLVVEAEQVNQGEVILKARYRIAPNQAASFPDTVKELDQGYTALGYMIRAEGPRVPYSFITAHLSS